MVKNDRFFPRTFEGLNIEPVSSILDPLPGVLETNRQRKEHLT